MRSVEQICTDHISSLLLASTVGGMEEIYIAVCCLTGNYGGNRNNLASPDVEYILAKLALEQVVENDYLPFCDDMR